MPNPILGTLTDEVQQTIGTMQSAKTLIEGIGQRVATLVAAALENGATEEQLSGFVALESELESNRTALAAAVVANS